MKKVLVCSLLILLLIVPLVSAKSILFIANKTALGTGSSCGELGLANKNFCEKLTGLGYDIITLDGKSVKSGNAVWNAAYQSVDLLFLGQVSTEALTKDYCGNISIANKKIFITANSIFCATQLGIVDVVPENNTIIQDKVYITNTHYITKDFDIDTQYENVYNEPAEVRVYQGTGIAGAYGEVSEQVDTYPAIKANDNSIFWGFERADLFGKTGWSLFERSIEFIMGDLKEDIILQTIPSKITKNKDFLIFITSDSEGPGNITYNSKIKELSLEGNYWTIDPITLFQQTEFDIKIGEFRSIKTITPGEQKIEIISRDFKDNYTIKATGQGPLYYRLLNSDLSEYSSGQLEEKDPYFEKKIEIINKTELILEITGEEGGAYKNIEYSEAIGLSKYTIEPDEWIITIKENTTLSKTFKIGTGIDSNMTNIRVGKSGFGKELEIDDDEIAKVLKEQRYTTFKASINTTKLELGRHEGTIAVTSNEHDFTIPITIYKINTTGFWLTISPYIWEVDVLEGQEKKQDFTLKNTGIYPSTDLKAEFKGTIHSMVSIGSQPNYILPKEQGTISLIVDASDIEAGEYKGRIELENALGDVAIVTTINVIDEDEVDWEELEERIDDLSGVDRNLLELITQNFNDAKDKWEAKEYSEALEILAIVENNLANLETGIVTQPDSSDLIVYAIAAVIIIFLIYLLWKYKDKFGKKKNKKQKDRSYLPSEENYRTEYY